MKKIFVTIVLSAALLATLICPITFAQAEDLIIDNSYINNALVLGETNIIGGINSVRRIDTYNEFLEVVNLTNLPQSIIYKVDDGLNVIFTDGSSISLSDAIALGENKIIPAFDIENEETGNKLIDFLKTNKYLDCFILSKEAALVKHVRSILPNLGGVIDYTAAFASQTKLTKTDLISIRESMHSNYGTIAILPIKFCTKDNIQYLYDSIVNVWASVEDDSRAMLYQGICSGAIGVITDQTNSFYNIAAKRFSANSLTRAPLNIAHRGLPVVAPENTIEGARLAYEAGADVIEFDIYITKDNKVVVMHDSTTGRTCNQDISIEESTLAQLKALYVNKGYESNDLYKECKIPTFEEYLAEFKGKNVRLFVEVKSYKDSIIPATKALIDEYEMYDQISFISFTPRQLENLTNDYPGSTTGLLIDGILDETGSQRDMLQVMQTIGKFNATLNPNKGGYGKNAVLAALSRGISIYPWTFNTKNEYLSYFMNGYSGLTGNDCRLLGNYAKTLDVSYSPKKYLVGDTVTFDINAVKYDKSKLNVNDDIKIQLVSSSSDAVKINGNKVTLEKPGTVSLILKYKVAVNNSTNYTIYSDVISINVEKQTDIKKILVIVVPSVLGGAIIGGAVAFIVKRRKALSILNKNN